MAESKPKKAQLVYKPVPPKSRDGATSVYVDAVQEFLDSGEQSAEVTGLATKTASIAIGLSKAIERLGVGDKVKVTRRTVDVYLERVSK